MRHHHHASKYLKKNPQKKKKQSIYETLMYAVAFVGPLTTYPQVYEIFMQHSVKDVSPWTWIGYQLLAVLWIIYGFKQKDKPIILTEMMWFVMQGLVLVGFYLYR